MGFQTIKIKNTHRLYCVISGVKVIFSRGGKVTFPDFFPTWNMLFPGKNSPFWYTQISVVSKKWKAKKKKSSAHFHNFSPSIFNFSPLPFQIFLLFPSIFPFFLAPLFPVGQQKFPGEKCQGALGPLPVMLLCVIIIVNPQQKWDNDTLFQFSHRNKCICKKGFRIVIDIGERFG